MLGTSFQSFERMFTSEVFLWFTEMAEVFWMRQFWELVNMYEKFKSFLILATTQTFNVSMKVQVEYKDDYANLQSAEAKTFVQNFKAAVSTI